MLANDNGFAIVETDSLEDQEDTAARRADFLKDFATCGLARPHYPFQSIAVRISPEGNRSVHVGRFQNILIARTFAQHLIAIGDTDGKISSRKDIGFPVGALALATAAVERALTMYRTGVYVNGGKKADHFSHENWGGRTRVYLHDAIKIADSRWPDVVQAAVRCITPAECEDDNDSKSEDEDMQVVCDGGGDHDAEESSEDESMHAQSEVEI